MRSSTIPPSNSVVSTNELISPMFCPKRGAWDAISARILAKNGRDWIVAPLMTGLVGLEPDPAMVSKKALTVLVTFARVPSSTSFINKSLDVSMVLIEVAESFRFRDIVLGGFARAIYGADATRGCENDQDLRGGPKGSETKQGGQLVKLWKGRLTDTGRQSNQRG